MSAKEEIIIKCLSSGMGRWPKLVGKTEYQPSACLQSFSNLRRKDPDLNVKYFPLKKSLRAQRFDIMSQQ